MTRAGSAARPRRGPPGWEVGGATGRASGPGRREAARPARAPLGGGGARRRVVLAADVRQALREVGQEGLADALTDDQIIATLDGQEAAVRAALAAGHIDPAGLGGAPAEPPSRAEAGDAYLVLAARDRLAYGRGWRAEELIPPWRHGPLRREPGWPGTLVGDAFWLAGICQGVGTPRGWTATDTLRWLAAERERILRRRPPMPGGRPELPTALEGFGAVALLLTQAERQLVGRLRARAARRPAPTPLKAPGPLRPGDHPTPARSI